MRIANYLRPDCVALRQRADSLTGAVQQMVTLLDGTDNLTDTAVFAADVRARLALGGVCVGNGLAIPHGTNDAKGAIRHSGISFVRYPEPIDWNGKPAEFVVGIAGAGKDHMALLTRIAHVFLNKDEVERLRRANTPEEVRAVLSEAR